MITKENISQKNRLLEILFKHSKTFRAEFIKGDTDHVIYALHGYGQLSKYFIRKFDELANQYSIIAPEGMHRFYRNGTSGRVGASWMTKEMRETDIADNMEWLSSLYLSVEEKNKYSKKTLLGFSQGGSTAIRLAKYGDIQLDHLIVWGSDYPPEEIENGTISVKRKIFVVGLNDPYFPEDRRIELSQIYAKEGFEIITYEGGHDIDTNILKDILTAL